MSVERVEGFLVGLGAGVLLGAVLKLRRELRPRPVAPAPNAPLRASELRPLEEEKTSCH